LSKHFLSLDQTFSATRQKFSGLATYPYAEISWRVWRRKKC
jgi:hypothetical protein